MRALCDLATNDILQVEKDPEVGALVPMNGKYVVAFPEGSTVQVTRDSVVLPPSDPSSILSQGFAGFLAQHPQYDHVLYNGLIEDVDVDDLDLTASPTIGGNALVTRAQTGRGTGGSPSGMAGLSTAILPVNDTVTPNRPGLLVTSTIDISPLLPVPSECFISTANDFVVWWKIYEVQTTHDIRSEFGAHAGENEPSLRNIIETDQEPSGFEVYISTDDGRSWERANRLVPVCTCPGVEVRLAFLNNSTTKLYLASYAILF